MDDKPEGVLAETTEPMSNIVKPKEPETVTSQPTPSNVEETIRTLIDQATNGEGSEDLNKDLVQNIAEEVSEAVNELIPQSANGEAEEKDVTISLVNDKNILPGQSSVDVKEKEDGESLEATISLNMGDKPEGVMAETVQPVSDLVQPNEPQSATSISIFDEVEETIPQSDTSTDTVKSTAEDVVQSVKEIVSQIDKKPQDVSISAVNDETRVNPGTNGDSLEAEISPNIDDIAEESFGATTEGVTDLANEVKVTQTTISSGKVEVTVRPLTDQITPENAVNGDGNDKIKSTAEQVVQVIKDLITQADDQLQETTTNPQSIAQERVEDSIKTLIDQATGGKIIDTEIRETAEQVVQGVRDLVEESEEQPKVINISVTNDRAIPPGETAVRVTPNADGDSLEAVISLNIEGQPEGTLATRSQDVQDVVQEQVQPGDGNPALIDDAADDGVLNEIDVGVIRDTAEQVAQAVNDFVSQEDKLPQDISISIVNDKALADGESDVEVKPAPNGESLEATISVRMEEKPEGPLAEGTAAIEDAEVALSDQMEEAIKALVDEASGREEPSKTEPPRTTTPVKVIDTTTEKSPPPPPVREEKIKQSIESLLEEITGGSGDMTFNEGVLDDVAGAVAQGIEALSRQTAPSEVEISIQNDRDAEAGGTSVSATSTAEGVIEAGITVNVGQFPEGPLAMTKHRYSFTPQ